MYSCTIFSRGLIEMATAVHRVAYRVMFRQYLCSAVVPMNNCVEMVLAENGLRSACGYVRYEAGDQKRGNRCANSSPTSS